MCVCMCVKVYEEEHRTKYTLLMIQAWLVLQALHMCSCNIMTHACTPHIIRMPCVRACPVSQVTTAHTLGSCCIMAQNYCNTICYNTWTTSKSSCLNCIPYGRKFWRGIYFGGLAVLRAIRQTFYSMPLYVTSSICRPQSFKMSARKL